MSSDINHLVLTGRLTADAESKAVGQSTVFSFSLAVNKYSKKEGKDIASFFNCKMWAGTEGRANFYGDCLKKGAAIVLEGSLDQEKWNGSDGKQQSRVVILGTSFTPIGGNRGGESSDSFPSEDNGFPFN